MRKKELTEEKEKLYRENGSKQKAESCVQMERDQVVYR